MEELIEFIRSENDLLDRQMEERRERWHVFWHGFNSYVSTVHINSRPILAPVMTVEKRQEMQVYRKQACITEVKIKTRSREKEFLSRVERSLEEIQRETSEKEMSLAAREHESYYPTHDTFEQTNNNAADTDSSLPGEIIHIKPSPPDGNGMKVRARRHQPEQLTRKDSDSVHTSDSDDAKNLFVVTVPKIHRRRRESGGSTGSEASRPASRQRTMSNSSINSEPAVRVQRPHDMLSSEQQQTGKAPVRRTGSDGNCRLRRSGSERSLKRSGSDKALRRTGSGDIPTAIMSDSTPRMHRRVLSGDMSSLHTNKQSAINKLTRSYDMSIRSLMSEELSVRAPTSHPPTDHSKDISGNELVVEPMPPSHTLLLSPKYAAKDSTAPATAVKLLSRATSQPLKKQTSPNKEAGPPQPLKGIHTLPPSLPVSRENTFDSLPQKSPTLSDGGEGKDSKSSRRSSVVTADFLEVNSVNELHKKTEVNSSKGDLTTSAGGSHQMTAILNKLEATGNIELPQSPLVNPPTTQQSSAGTTDHNSNSKHVEKPEATESSSQTVVEEEIPGDCHRAHSNIPADNNALVHAGKTPLLSSVKLSDLHNYDEGGMGEPAAKTATPDVWNVGYGDVSASPGYLHLPDKLTPAPENLTQQWLVDKISQLHCSGEVNIEDWLQNAPDSVKQKLNKLLPDVNRNEVGGADQDVGVSIDDTLRSTTPLPEESEPITESLEEQTSPSQTTPTRTPFLRSNSYTLDQPSEALLSADKANRVKTSSKFFPSPDRSDSLPITHNRVEGKTSHPSNSSTSSPRSPASVPLTSTSTQPISVYTDMHSSNTTDCSSHSPSAIERNKAVPSKSYVVTEPSAALLDSLNESQKSALESAVNSAITDKSLNDDVSTLSDCSTLRQSVQDCNGTESKQGAQRKLEYFSLANLSAAAGTQPPGGESHSSPATTYHGPKYESTDAPRRANIQQYLHKLGLSDKPIKEAWGNKSQSNLQTQSKYRRSHNMETLSPDSDGGDSGSRSTVPNSSDSNSSSKNSGKSSEKTTECSSPSSKNLKENEEMFKTVRRELTLLKSKYHRKLSVGEATDQRPSSAGPKAAVSQVRGKDQRPSTAFAHSSPYTSKAHTQHLQQFVSRAHTQHLPQSASKVHTQHMQQSVNSSADKSLAELRERIYTANKNSGGTASGHPVKSFAEKEATPISTGYSSYLVPEADDSTGGYSSYGGIHSVTHPRPSTAAVLSSSPNQGHISPHTRSTSQSASQSKCRTIVHPSPHSTTRLAAVIKGHLCRRLLSTNKVQSIVKTIRDCQNLLPCKSESGSGSTTRTSHSQTLTLQDLNFQERLLDQWQAALLDIHEIFFELPVDKRIALIHQSEVLAARAQQQKAKSKVVRKTSNKEQQPPKKRISSTTQKVMERKKVHKAAPEPTTKKPAVNSTAVAPTATVLSRKSVLVPTFAANSPKKYVPATTSDRLHRAYVKRSPVKKSQDSPSSRQVSRV